MKNIFFKSILELSKLLSKKYISSYELTKIYINRAKLIEKNLNSFISLNEDYSLHLAKESDYRRSIDKTLGKLDGIPISLKDNICELNQTLTCGSKMLKDYKSIYDATVTKKLKNNGMVLLGRTNMDEFAMGSSTERSYFGSTSNPWNFKYTAGGSSGGSAAAVAAGITPLSLGSDTGGSIRQPASHCGIVGLKPTYGLISRYGLTAFASSLDHIGPLSHTVKDSALILQLIAGYDNKDSTSLKVKIPNYIKSIEKNKKNNKKWTFGVMNQSYDKIVNHEVQSFILKAIDFYKNKGHKMTNINIKYGELAPPIYYILSSGEASSNLSRYDGVRYTYRPKNINKNLISKTREEGFGEEVKRRILLGTYILGIENYNSFYIKAQKIRTLIKNNFEEIFKKVDFLISPTVSNTAFLKNTKIDNPLSMYLEDVFTIFCNLTGYPGISLPCGFSKEGLPIGFQIIGKPFKEDDLLSFANEFEEAHNYYNIHPNL